jgi:pilus assembly protein CpaC
VKMPAGLLLMFLMICAFSAAQAQAPHDLATTPHASTQDSANELFVAVGKSVLIDIAKPIQRIAVGLGDVAEATAVSPEEILVNGKTAGDTSLIVWEGGGGRQFYNVVVRPSPGVANDRLEGLRRELRTELPGQPIRVSTDNGLIFLRGTVRI